MQKEARQGTAFPDDFLWSASTSAYQFEGHFENDEKGLSVQEVKAGQKEVLWKAADHVHHLDEDIALLKQLGVRAYRFSIAWSRILPEGSGRVSEQGLMFYHRLIDGLVENGILPIVTLLHDDLPLALARQGGWFNRKTIDAFLTYCRILFEHFGRQVFLWQPIGEQNLQVIAEITAQRHTLSEIFQMNHHLFLAQAGAVKLGRAYGVCGKFSPALNLVEVIPASPDPLDVLAAKQMATIRNWMFLDVAMLGEYSSSARALLRQLNAEPVWQVEDEALLREGVCDQIAFSTYTSVCVGAWKQSGFQDHTGMKYGFNLPGMFEIVPNPCLKPTEFAAEVDPLGTRLILQEAAQRYQKPIFAILRSLGQEETISEEGKIHDEARIRYLALQFQQMKAAIANGVQLIGICPWSAFDLVSTAEGWKRRYGFVYVDQQQNCRRIPKQSYAWYRGVIAENGRTL